MTHAEFHAAILDEPDDDLTRLVFADWLDERGEDARAAFMRLGVYCDRARASPVDSEAWRELPQLGRAADAAFHRAWPAEFQVPGTFPLGHRFGQAILHATSNEALNSISRAAWLPDAAAACWVGAVRVTCCDGRAVERAWSGRAAGLPLDAEAPPGLPDELRTLLNHPFLISIGFDAPDLTKEVARHLACCEKLRTVTVYGSDVPDTANALARLARVPKLRRINLHSPLGYDGPVPIFPALTRLVLFRNAVTDAAVPPFAAANPRVTIGVPT